MKAFENWTDNRTPKVDPLLTDDSATPFLIIEARKMNSVDGITAAKNQLAVAMARVHDVLCCLDIQDRLYVLGLVQIGPTVTIYASYSTTRPRQEDQIVLCDKVRSAARCATISAYTIRLTLWGSDLSSFRNLERSFRNLKVL